MEMHVPTAYHKATSRHKQSQTRLAVAAKRVNKALRALYDAMWEQEAARAAYDKTSKALLKYDRN